MTDKEQFLRLAKERGVFGFRIENKPKPTLVNFGEFCVGLVKNSSQELSMSEAINLTVESPTTDNILVEDLDQSQEPNRPRTVSRELNLDFAQFFYPNESRRIFEIRCFKSEVTDQGITQSASAVVNPHATLGTLTTFDERVFYALVELWQEQGKVGTCLFSEREIARRINLSWGKNTAKAIGESLIRLRGVLIEWQGSFYDSVQSKFIEIRNPFTIVNHLKMVSTKDGGIGSQIAEFGFDERVVENLNSNYSRPVRFDVILSFHSPLAQALYTFIDPKLYGTKQYHRTTQGLIDDLGLMGKSYKRKAVRVQEFGKLQKELIGKPTSFGEVIDKYEIRSGKDDALLWVTRSGAARIKGQKIEVLETPQIKRSETPQKSQKPRQEAEKTQARETPTSTPKKPLEAKSEALEALNYFDEIFGLGGDGDKQHSQNVVTKAEAFIKRDGLEKTKFLIDFARREARKTDYQPRTFNGITQYRSDALKAWKANVRFRERQEREAQKMAQIRYENARLDHEKIYRDDYHEYVNELVCSLGDDYPECFNEFRCWQAEKRREKEEELEGNPMKERILEVFDREGQILLRLSQFFKDNPDIHIPDFWEWDSTHNPNSFGKKSEEGGSAAAGNA